METKICTKCLNKISILNFYTKYNKPTSQCKDCLKAKTKKYRLENKEKYQKYFIEYQDKNKEDIKVYKNINYLNNKEKIKERSRLYYENNKEEQNRKNSERQKNNRDIVNKNNRIRNKDRRDNDPLFRLVNNIRTSILNSIKSKGYKKSSKTAEILDCSYNEFIIYLESKFESWMTWDNYGKYNGEFYYGWDIDHIIPISSAKSEDVILKLNHFTNLQPLCSKINRDIKKDKIEYEI